MSARLLSSFESFFCKEVIYMKNVVVNAVCTAIIGYGIFAGAATVIGIAYYVYVDFIR